MSLTFKGGFHPEGKKDKTAAQPIIELDAPAIMIIPLSQHIGAVCAPLVNAGDYVYMGQKIGDSKEFVSVPIHSSVSGKVIAVEPRAHAVLGECMSVVIENDFKYEIHGEVKPILGYDKMSAAQLTAHIRESGMVGLGGATFPTFIKLSPPKEKAIDTLIINGAECEPYLTADHRLMLQKPSEVVDGLIIMMKILNVKKGIIAIEDNKKDAYEVMKNVCAAYDGISAVLVKTKYPQGSEKHLISAVLKRQVKSGGLPSDVGVVVINVATSAEISGYFKTGLPLIKRILTISGSGCKKPCNLSVRIGTPFSEVIKYAGKADDKEIKKIISGGPMMGTAVYSEDVPVTKGTSGILLFTGKEYKNYKQSDCLRCGRCVDSCPMRLMPCMITEYTLLNDLKSAEKYGLKDCMECGVCSYICPSRRHLVQTIKVGKSKV